VHLGERCGGDWDARKLIEDGVRMFAQFALDLFHDLLEGTRGDAILQAAEHGDILGGRDIRAAGYELAGLDEEAFHPGGQPVDALGVALVLTGVPLFPFLG
jgi:hypothetical protein